MVRDEILSRLLSGGSVGGAEAAQALGVSRNAVWKAVEELRRDGWRILADRRGGYRLEGVFPLTEEGVRAGVPAGAPDFGLRILCGVDSTQAEAQRMLLSGARPPFAVIAESQTGGVCRGGQGFPSAIGGLYMTLVLPGGMPLDRTRALRARTALCAAKAVAEVIQKRPLIHWINDLYLDGEKVCGVLTEADLGLERGLARNVRVGIGLLPALFAGAEARRAFLAGRLAAAVLDFDPERAPDLSEYASRSDSPGRRVSVLDGVERTGLCRGFDGEGNLLLETADGLYVCTGGEMTVLP